MNLLKSVVATAVVAGGAALLSGPAAAAPTYLGPTGFVLTPDCNVTRHWRITSGYHYLGRGILDAAPASTFVVNAGILDHLEVGATGVKINGDEGFDAGWLNAKLSVFRPDNTVQLAAGVMDATGETDRAVYVIGLLNGYWYLRRHQFPLKGLKLGVGWGSGNVIDGLFVNGTWSLGTVLEIIGEWHTDAAGRELVNIGGRFRTGPKSLSGLAWDIGAIGLNTDNPRLAGGLSYRYRRYKSKEAGSSHDRGTTGQGGDGSGG